MLASKRMLAGMKSKTQQLKERVNRLRMDTDPKFRKEFIAIADSLDDLLDGAAKGGRVRAKRLSKKRRKEIASNAAKVRWAK